MWLRFCLPLVVILLRPVLSCAPIYNRVPDNTDVTVDCSTRVITVDINLCSAQWAGFNATGLALNGAHDTPSCLGTIVDGDPPVIRYELPVNHSQANPCRQSLQIVDELPDPSGPFSEFLNVQSVIITGFVDTPRSSEGTVSYSTDLYYHFSCRYPLEYLLNNTQITASSVSVATKYNNGTFIDTLRMAVYNDSNYDHPLTVPMDGLTLRTNIYVEVKAINLTGSFNVFMDHCFATSIPFNLTHTVQHDFFTPCTVKGRTSITTNGQAKNARFNFEAFRFVEHRDQEKSTIYLHCMLRLCEPTKCQQLINGCSKRRRKRSIGSADGGSDELATVSYGPLPIAREVPSLTTGDGTAASQPATAGDSAMTRVVLGAVFGSAAVTLVGLASWVALKKYYFSAATLRAFN